MSILLSVTQPYAGLLVDGKKTIEWRKSALPMGKAYIYETAKCGGCGKVIGEVRLLGGYRVGNNPLAISKKLLNDGCVDVEALEKYANGKELYGTIARNNVRYETPRPLSDFSKVGFPNIVPLKRPPQSWCYAEEIK